MKYISSKVNRADILAIGVLLILAVIFFFRLFYPEPGIIATPEIGVSDIWQFNFPLKNYLSESLKNGTVPLWNPYRANGFPDVAESQVGTFNLYNFFAFSLLPSIHAFNVGHIVIFMTTATGMYFFIKRQNINIPIALMGGFIYSFSGFFITHISHFLLIQTASFFPWLIYFTDRLLIDKKNRMIPFVGFSFTLSQQLFSGNPQTVFISLIAVMVYSFFIIITKKTTRLSIFYVLIATCLGIIISAIQVLPTYELTQLSNRGEGLSPQELLFYKYPLKHLVTFINPFWFGNPQTATYPHFNDFSGSLFWENTGYIGILPLILACISLFQLRKKSPIILFYCLLMIGSFLLMLGGDSPLYFLLVLPPFSFFRFPSRFMIIFLFALTMLAVYGLTQLQNLLPNKFKRTVVVIALCIVITNVFFVWLQYHPVIPFRQYKEKPEVVKILEAEKNGTVYTYLQNARAFSEFFSTGALYPQRYISLRNELPPNLNVLYRIPTIDTYTSLGPRRTATYNAIFPLGYKIASNSAQLSPDLVRRLSLRNVTHILSPIEINNTSLTLSKKLQLESQAGDLYIYRNTQAVPKMYLVNHAISVNTLEELESILNSPNFSISDQIIVEQQLEMLNPLESIAGTITELEHDPYTTRLRIETNTEAVLVLTQTYYPGWKAKIDTVESPVFPVNLINQGIVIPKGNHTVTVFYESTFFVLGVIITGIGYGMLGLLFSHHLIKVYVLHILLFLHKKLYAF